MGIAFLNPIIYERMFKLKGGTYVKEKTFRNDGSVNWSHTRIWFYEVKRSQTETAGIYPAAAKLGME